MENYKEILESKDCIIFGMATDKDGIPINVVWRKTDDQKDDEPWKDPAPPKAIAYKVENMGGASALYKMLTRDEGELTDRISAAYENTKEYMKSHSDLHDLIVMDLGENEWRDNYEITISGLINAVADNSYMAGYSDALKMMMNLK